METRRGAETSAFICAAFSGGSLTLKCAAHLTLGGVAAAFARLCCVLLKPESIDGELGAPPVPQLKKTGVNLRGGGLFPCTQ